MKKGISKCEKCGQEFCWTRSNNAKLPRFCSLSCRGCVVIRTRKKNCELTPEENFERIKKYYEKYVIKQEGCWDWNGTIEKTGYAILSIRPLMKAHRASWIVHNGEIPIGMLVCHTCDNRRCTNPDHLWLGTYKDNTQDKIKKGRSNTAKGSNLKVAKLNEEKVEDIKTLLKKGLNCGEIGRQFDVSRKIISRIKNGDTWKHVS